MNEVKLIIFVCLFVNVVGRVSSSRVWASLTKAEKEALYDAQMPNVIYNSNSLIQPVVSKMSRNM